jgi:hypothetical protein
MTSESASNQKASFGHIKYDCYLKLLERALDVLQLDQLFTHASANPNEHTGSFCHMRHRPCRFAQVLCDLAQLRLSLTLSCSW